MNNLLDAKVTFPTATTGSALRPEVEVEIPAGATGKVVKIVNSIASVVVVKGRKLVVWNDDFQVVA